MSDQYFEQDEDEAAPGEILPPATAAQRPRGAFVAIWAGIAALLGGAVFALALLSGGGGGGDPEEAVRNMFDAVEAEDLLGVLDSLAPSERDLLKDNLQDVSSELERLGVLAEGVNLGDIAGIELEIDGLTLAATPVGDGVTAVRVTGGTATYTVTPSELPVGGFVRDLLGEDLPTEAMSDTEAIAEDDSDAQVVTIREDGRWYVSLAYSIAEAVRESAGERVPDFGNGLVAKGSSTPDGAVREMVAAATKLDLRRVLELLPPDEAKVLHDYAPLFLDDVDASLNELGDYEIRVEKLELSTKRVGNEAIVDVKSFAVSGRFEEDTVSLAFDGKCTTIDVADGPQRTCPDDTSETFPFLGSLLSDNALQTGVVVVQRDGEWFVSPTRTVFAAILETLRALDRQELDEIVDGFRGFFLGGFGVSESSSSYEFESELEYLPELSPPPPTAVLREPSESPPGDY